MAQFRYAEEEGSGTRFSESVAMMEINGGQPDYGADGALNCNQACAEAQQFFRSQTPPVNAEVVIEGNHAVLRMPDGTYYDPSRAMSGGPPGNPQLSTAEGQRYEGARGISVAERDTMAAEARRAVAGLPPGTPEHVREQLAVGAAREKAEEIEDSANLLANDADGQPATAEEAQARAEEARIQAQTAAASGDPVATADSANHALNTMREANQMAVAEGLPPPYPLADQTPDAAAAGQLSAQQQTELFGAPLPLSQDTEVQADVATLQGAPNPAAAATQLEQMLTDATPEYREALLSDPEVQRILGDFATYEPPPGDPQYQEGVNSLVRLAEAVGPDQAHLLTDPIAANYTLEQTYQHFLPALRSASSAGMNMEDSLGVSFAVSLDASMHAMGKADLASDVHNVATEAVAALQQQFGDVSGEVNQLQQELYLFLQEFGPAMTQAEQQSAIDAFMAKHQDVYDKFEKMGGLLAGTMGVIQERGMANEEVGYESISEVLASHMPALSMTKAGGEFLQDAIQRASAGEPSFLDVALSIAKDSDDYAKTMGDAMLTALGSRASQLIASGQTDAAQAMLRGMEGFAPLFGLPEDQFGSVLGSIDTLVANPGASPAEAEANLQRTLDEIKGTLGDSTASRMMSAFAVGMAGVVFAQGVSNWNQEDQNQLVNRLSTVAAGAEVGVEGGLLLAKIWGDTAFGRVAPRLLQPIAEKVLPAVGIGLDAWNGIAALGRGEYGRAGLHGVSIVGGVLMMAGGPVGVLAGGALVIGSAIGLSILDNDEARKKAREEFLRDAGLPEDVIQPLVNAESGRIEELVGMGFDYSQLVRMATLAPDMFTESSGEGFLMERVQGFQQQTGLDADGLMGMFEAMAAAAPGTAGADATSGFFQLLNSPAPPQTEEGWIAYFNEVAQAYAEDDDGEMTAMMQAAIQYLQST